MISIVIPTLNEEKVIESTLRRLTALTLAHEVIVSDGGSTDGTVELAARYATVVTVDGRGSQTIAEGRNMGAEAAAADSEFLVFLDADCVIPEPNRFFARALSCFAANPKLVGLTAQLRVLAANERLADRIVLGIANLGIWLGNNVLRRGISFGEFQMVRRGAFGRVNGYRADLVAREDADLFRRLSRIGDTRLDWALKVLHTGRRYRAVGWPRLIARMFLDMASMALRDRAFSKEWTPIR